MMNSIVKKISVLLFISVSIFACKDDDDTSVKPDNNINPNEEELITTVELIFSDTMNIPLDTFYFRDIDGVGGQDPVIDSIFLMTNTNYQLQVRFLDESDPNNIEDITEEVRAEDDEHLVCFDSDAAALNIQITDSDGTYPLGLSSVWETASAVQSSVTIALKHQPDIKNGNCDIGETDVEVSFPLIVQ